MGGPAHSGPAAVRSGIIIFGGCNSDDDSHCSRHQRLPDMALSTQVNLLGRHFGLIAAPLTRGRIPMEYKGVEYSVVQLTDGIGWRWEIRLDDGKNKSGSTPVSRAVAIKQAEHEIDRILKSGK